jgi:hypothetical protein
MGVRNLSGGEIADFINGRTLASGIPPLSPVASVPTSLRVAVDVTPSQICEYEMNLALRLQQFFPFRLWKQK